MSPKTENNSSPQVQPAWNTYGTGITKNTTGEPKFKTVTDRTRCLQSAYRIKNWHCGIYQWQLRYNRSAIPDHLFGKVSPVTQPPKQQPVPLVTQWIGQERNKTRLREQHPIRSRHVSKPLPSYGSPYLHIEIMMKPSHNQTLAEIIDRKLVIYRCPI